MSGSSAVCAAVLTLPGGTPFSEVVESYTADVLAFPVPRP
jgi:hypothetical protein